MSRIDVISDKQHLLGESPVWDAKARALYWVDIVGQTLYCYTLADEKIRQWQFNEDIGSIGLCDVGIVMALRSGIYHFDCDTEALTHIVTPKGEPAVGTRFNDGKVAPDGRFVVGTMDEAIQEPLGKLYSIDTQGQVTVLKEGFVVSNGLAWSPDGSVMYHACTQMEKIWAYDYDVTNGTISNERILAEPDDTVGRPDGSATDIEGCYWNAGVSAGMLNRYSPAGELILQILMPCGAPTMPCFGGDDMKTIFVTSLSNKEIAPNWQSYPHNGGVFAVRVDVPGVAVAKFNYQP